MAKQKQTPRERAIKKIEATINKYLDRFYIGNLTTTNFCVNTAATEIYDYIKLHHHRTARKPAPVFNNWKKKKR